jgi:hypothetical protein
VIANAGVLVAAGGVALTRPGWPDIFVGFAMTTMFATSAMHVIRDARQPLRAAPARQGPTAVPQDSFIPPLEGETRAAPSRDSPREMAC